MASLQLLYGVVIRDAIKTKDLKTMKLTAVKAKQTIRDQQDIGPALLDLLDAIEKLEKK